MPDVSNKALRLLHNTKIGTVMLVTFSRTTKPIKALFVGLEPGHYIILRFPGGVGIHDHLYEGNEAVVKYISEGQVFGFRTEVVGYLFKKGLILTILAHPRIVETHQLRKEQRVDFLVPAQLKVAETRIKGFVVDLSPGGCRFKAEVGAEKIPLDWDAVKEVIISFQLIGQPGIRDIACTVQNLASEGVLTLGLRFDDAEDSVTEGIRDYVQQVSSFLENQ